jgi:hypothetical protein
MTETRVQSPKLRLITVSTMNNVQDMNHRREINSEVTSETSEAYIRMKAVLIYESTWYHIPEGCIYEIVLHTSMNIKRRSTVMGLCSYHFWILIFRVQFNFWGHAVA